MRSVRHVVAADSVLGHLPGKVPVGAAVRLVSPLLLYGEVGAIHLQSDAVDPSVLIERREDDAAVSRGDRPTLPQGSFLPPVGGTLVKPRNSRELAAKGVEELSHELLSGGVFVPHRPAPFGKPHVVGRRQTPYRVLFEKVRQVCRLRLPVLKERVAVPVLKSEH